MDVELKDITNLDIVEIGNQPTDFRVYPNPVIDFITVDYTLKRPRTVNISIYNSLGMAIQRQRIIGTMEVSNSLRIQLNNNLPPGMYFIHISNGTTFKRTSHFIKL